MPSKKSIFTLPLTGLNVPDNALNCNLLAFGVLGHLTPNSSLHLDYQTKKQAIAYAEGESQTVIHCKIHWTSPLEEKESIWPSTFLRPKASFRDCRLLYAANIGIYPEVMQTKEIGIHRFTLIFEGLPKDCTYFDLEEDAPRSGSLYVPNIVRNSSDIYHITLPVNSYGKR